MANLNDIDNLKTTIASIENPQTEAVSKETYAKANAVIATMVLETPDDFLLYFASLNVANKYIKENKEKASYSFKSGVSTGIDAMIVSAPENIFLDR